MAIDTKGGVSRAENENGELAIRSACDEFSHWPGSYDLGAVTEADCASPKLPMISIGTRVSTRPPWQVMLACLEYLDFDPDMLHS